MFKGFSICVLAVVLTLCYGVPRTRRFTHGRIAGGTEAAPGTAPYNAGIVYANAFVVCSGSIISKLTILTTASCNFGPLNAFLEIHVGTNSPSSGVTAYKLSHFVNHPNFDYPYNDIALLILSEDIQFSETVSTIPLGTDNLGGGQNVTIAGWGDIDNDGTIPDKLQTIDLKTITNEECQEVLRLTLLPSHICTFTKIGEGLCYGDGGNGLVSNGEIVGLASYGEPCGLGFPDVFTRVSFYVDWINANKI